MIFLEALAPAYWRVVSANCHSYRPPRRLTRHSWILTLLGPAASCESEDSRLLTKSFSTLSERSKRELAINHRVLPAIRPDSTYGTIFSQKLLLCPLSNLTAHYRALPFSSSIIHKGYHIKIISGSNGFYYLDHRGSDSVA